MSEELQKSHFDPHLKDQFEVHPVDDDPVKLELVEVSEIKSEVTEGFSLLFRGPKEQFLNQGIKKTKHKKMGELDLFLVPVVSEKQDGFYYESVFNRLKEVKTK